MSSRTRAPSSGNEARARGRPRAAPPAWSERQTQAYLAARDLLRRIGRTHSLVMPAPERGNATRE
jgi:hypothetical protein